MSKQTSRIFYKGYDHKDAYLIYDGYVAPEIEDLDFCATGIVVCDENGDTELVWRKIFDDSLTKKSNRHFLSNVNAYWSFWNYAYQYKLQAIWPEYKMVSDGGGLPAFTHLTSNNNSALNDCCALIRNSGYGDIYNGSMYISRNGYYWKFVKLPDYKKYDDRIYNIVNFGHGTSSGVFYVCDDYDYKHFWCIYQILDKDTFEVIDEIFIDWGDKYTLSNFCIAGDSVYVCCYDSYINSENKYVYTTMYKKISIDGSIEQVHKHIGDHTYSHRILFSDNNVSYVLNPIRVGEVWVPFIFTFTQNGMTYKKISSSKLSNILTRDSDYSINVVKTIVNNFLKYYVYVFTEDGLVIFTTTNFIDYNYEKTITQMTVNGLNSSQKLYINFNYNTGTNSENDESITVYLRYVMESCCFENEKRIFPAEIVLTVSSSDWIGLNRGLQIYIDNPLFNESEGNFYFKEDYEGMAYGNYREPTNFIRSPLKELYDRDEKE